METFQPSIFSELSEYKKENGVNIIDLSIGSPDLPPPSFVTKVLSDTVTHEGLYGYSLTGTHEFNQAVVQHYEDNYDVTLNANKEILQLMGSQDGLVHFPMVFANPRDIILVPDPGYTAYAAGIAMAGAAPFFMPLKKENHFLPDFSKIPAEVANKAKVMILNFPGNPVPSMASTSFFNKVVAFAKRHNILILHDFAYSELYFDGKKPVSFLSISGAKDVGVEMCSFSKNFNMAGCRIGYLSGNEAIVQAVSQFKSNLDYGVFLPIQKAAITALRDGAAFCEESREIYQKRRDILVDGLNRIGWQVMKPEGGMFLWAEVPERWNSIDFTYALIDRAHVVVTPGQAFGPTGEGYVRIALVQNVTKLRETVSNIERSGLF
jgi:LL-diaminopimelate aminotransferase